MAAKPRKKRVSGSRTRAGFLLTLNIGWDGTTVLAFAGASSRAECREIAGNLCPGNAIDVAGI
jgi:hypothetical protein